MEIAQVGSGLIGGAAAIIGLVNGVRLLQEANKTKNFWGFGLFCFAVVAGLVFGFLHWFELNPETGFVLGLQSSGVYRSLEVVAKKQ